jgi:hypothetical protein
MGAATNDTAAMPRSPVSMQRLIATSRPPSNGFPGCCNTYRIGNLLVLGDQPAAVPVPLFGLNCTLLNSAVVVLFQPADQGTTFNLPLPPTLPPVTLYAQGASLYFTTFGLTTTGH